MKHQKISFRQDNIFTKNNYKYNDFQEVDSGTLTAIDGSVYNLSSNGEISIDMFFGTTSFDTTRDVKTSGGTNIKGLFNGYRYNSGTISAPSNSYFNRWDCQVAMGLLQGGADATIGGAIGKSMNGIQRAVDYSSQWVIMSKGIPKNGKFQYGIRNIETNFHFRIERHRLQTSNGGELGTHINYGVNWKKHYFPIHNDRYRPYVKE